MFALVKQKFIDWEDVVSENTRQICLRSPHKRIL